jgi:hypothetical protein
VSLGYPEIVGTIDPARFSQQTVKRASFDGPARAPAFALQLPLERRLFLYWVAPLHVQIGAIPHAATCPVLQLWKKFLASLFGLQLILKAILLSYSISEFQIRIEVLR